MEKEYFFKDGTNEQNLWAYLYMECNDHNEEHMLNAFQSYSTLSDTELHKENVNTIKWYVEQLGLDGFMKAFEKDAEELRFDYFPEKTAPFENTFYIAVGDAISEDITYDDKDIEPADNNGDLIDGIAKYKGEKFNWRDNTFSATPSYLVAAAIDLARSKLENAVKERKPIERE